VHVLALQEVPVKTPGRFPLVPQVQFPPPLYPALQVTITTSPVVPVILEAVALFENCTFVAVHELMLQAEPVKFPLVPHVQFPPPLYPALQLTVTTAPVVPVILEEGALFEKLT